MKPKPTRTRSPSPPQGVDRHAFFFGTLTKVQVSRATLRECDLHVTDCITLTHVHYRHGRRRTVTNAELACMWGTRESTASRSLKRLRQRGWLDAFNRPAKPLPTGKDGFVEIEYESLRQRGRNDALLEGQLFSLHKVHKAVVGEKVQVNPGQLADLLGMKGTPERRGRRCRDSMRRTLQRLESGETTAHRVRARAYKRRGETGEQPLAIPVIERQLMGGDKGPRRGQKLHFRFTSIAERLRIMRRKAAELAPAARPGNTTCHAPGMDALDAEGLRQLAAMLEPVARTGPPGASPVVPGSERS